MRVVIAEDQALLREGLARLFRDSGHHVVATLSDADRLLTTVERERPDLAVVDIRMPPTFTDEGARAARAIREQHAHVGVLVLSQHIETTHAVSLVAYGGFGYLLKDRVSKSTSSSPPPSASPAAAPPSTPPSSPTSSPRSATDPSRGSPNVNAACSSSWPKD